MTYASRLTAILAASTVLAAGLAGCGHDQRPKNGYYGSRADRGMNIDSDSPGIPERSGFGVGRGPGNEPQGENAPVPSALRDTAPPSASPAADRAPGALPRTGAAGGNTGINPATQPSR